MHSTVGRMCLGLAIAAGLSVAVVGCSSHHGDKASVERREKAVNTVSDLRTDLKRADGRVAMTQQTVERLSTQQAGNLKPTYDSLTDDISKNRSINESLGGRARDLADEATKHVNEWDYRARTIQSEPLRQRSLEREQQARREQEETMRAVNEVRGLYTQYIRNLEDISTYASNDLTPRGMAGMREQVQRSDQMAQDLRNRMAQLDVRLDRLAEAWRTDTPLAVRVTEDESARQAGEEMQPANQQNQPIQPKSDTPANQNGM